jgi:hypothetical protein
VSRSIHWSDILSDQPFAPIAERELRLRGPADRVVRLSIGSPEPDPVRGGNFRCPFQVVGLSDDSVHYAHGVDSFQALNLAFAGIRHLVKTSADVLSSFHQDFSLTWHDMPWEAALPVWVALDNPEQVVRLERFKEELWSRTKPDAD